MDNRILDDLISLYVGPLIVVRPFPRAAEKIIKCAGCSPLELVQNIIKRHPKSSLFSFEEFNTLETLRENDLVQSLLDSLEKNDREVGKTLENTLGDRNEKYSRWFQDWCFTLAKILRIKANERFETALERNGVFIFLDNDDDFRQLEEVLENYSGFPVTIIYFSHGNATNFSVVINKFNVQYLILQSFEDFDYSKLFDFASKFIDSCYKNLESNVTSLNAFFKGVKISSKILKSEPQKIPKSEPQKIPKSEPQKIPKSEPLKIIKSEPLKNLSNLFMLLCDELGTGNDSFISSVSKSTLDHEIHALSHLLYGIHLYNCKFKPQSPGEKQGEDSDKNIEISSIISHLDKASLIYNKHEHPWESFFTNTLSVLLGEYEEFSKLLSNNAILQPSTKSEFARSAVFIELSSNLCSKPKKKIFQLVMAGRLFSQAGLENLSKRCYLSCLEEYEDWYITHEHLYSLLATFDENFLVNCLNILSNTFENIYTNYSYENNYTNHSFSHLHQTDSTELSSQCSELTSQGRKLGSQCLELPSESWKLGSQSWRQVSGNQIYYLKTLMKLQGFRMRTKYLKNTPISAPFLNYPTIYYTHGNLPLVNNKMPFLVRVPIIHMRSNGVNGTNVKLSTTYVDDLYEKLLDNSFTDPMWQKCLKFYNIKDHTRKNLYPAEKSKGSDYMINTTLKLSLQLLNPLSIPVDCHDFKILVQEIDPSNKEKVNPIKVSDNNSEHLDNNSERLDNPDEHSDNSELCNLEWVDCEILSRDKEGFRLGEFEKKSLILSFTTTNTGSFKIAGLCWNLFGEVVFWSPIYTVGKINTVPKVNTVSKVNTVGNMNTVGKIDKVGKIDAVDRLDTIGKKGLTGEVGKKISLREFINEREVDKSLYFNVFRDMPCFRYYFRKVSDLALLSNTVFYPKRDSDTSNYDNLVRKYMEMYSEATESMKSEELENENLCLFDCFNGESSLIEISLQNTQETPIKSIELRLKVFGAFSVPPYPVSYKLSTPNISITTPTDPFDLESVFSSSEILDSPSTVQHKYDPDRLSKLIQSSWSVINLPNFKVKEVSLTEKMYEVHMQFNDDAINLHKKALSVYLFFQPLMVMDGISLINGSISVSPKRGLDLVIPFKLFLRSLKGPTFNAHFNYKDTILVKAINNSREEITQLKFNVNGEPVETNYSELCPVPPKNTMNFPFPLENALKYLDPASLQNSSDRMRFGVFWATPVRFGLFNGNVEFLEYKVLVRLTVSKTQLKFSDEPVIVSLFVTVHNISSESLKSLAVYPLIKHHQDSLISFVGVTKNRIDAIDPGCSKSIEFNIIIPVPGVYHFSSHNFKLVGTPEEHVTYQDNTNTIIVHD
ncbi:hypothetical protein TpMuguga_01g00933 [Theileria parva strain Muguga]|uniref:Uncharacterized protein n=1 Tax=Theileria parva TaxID=5875 RepID=Q4N787_THEPA|nr:uncharacterized protein TpMuguga_01g00933 [Theileria parva strain Muguga]EAN34171.1 hypothetical protein TpMuguga_01g00933 [Theileria parva strain Muguga]|eukprot:XP_766454.1 hypothetical protein [Theileria parva strain Muguga]